MELINLLLEEFEIVKGKKEPKQVYKYNKDLDQFKIEAYTLDAGKSFDIYISEKVKDPKPGKKDFNIIFRTEVKKPSMIPLIASNFLNKQIKINKENGKI